MLYAEAASYVDVLIPCFGERMVCRGVSVLYDVVLQVEDITLFCQIAPRHLHGVTHSLQVLFVNGVIELHIVSHSTW